MATITIDQATEVLDKHRLVAVNACGRDNATLSVLLKAGKFSDSDIRKTIDNRYYAEWMIRTKRSGDAFFVAEEGTIPGQGGMAFKAAELPMQTAVVPSQISERAYTQGKLWDANMLKFMLEDESDAWARLMAIMLWNEGTGVLTRTRSAPATGDGTSVTLKVLDIAWLLGAEGTHVDIHDTLGNEIIANAEVAEVKIDSWEVTLLTANTSTVPIGSYIIMYKNYNLMPLGITAAVSDGVGIGLAGIFDVCGGTKSYGGVSLDDVPKHAAYIDRTDPALGLVDWDDNRLLNAAVKARSLAGKGAPKVDTLICRKEILMYMRAHSKSIVDAMQTFKAGEKRPRDVFGYPPAAFYADPVFANGQAEIYVDETAPMFSIWGLNLKDPKGLQVRWTGPPDYFGEKMESLANSQNKLLRAQKFGTHLSPILPQRASGFALVNIKGHPDYLPVHLK